MAESIERTLGRIEGKLDAWLEITKADANHRKEVDARLDRLENWKTGLVAAGSAALFIIGVAYKLLLDYVGRH